MAEMIIIMICVAAIIVLLIDRMRLKKEIYELTDWMEKSLDELMMGMEPEDHRGGEMRNASDTEDADRLGNTNMIKDADMLKVPAEMNTEKKDETADDIDTEDTLKGKLSEKLERVAHIGRSREEELGREKEQIKELISDVSHQTKTPIANMKLYLELLQEEKMTGKGAQFLASMQKQTDKLDFLFENMVKMSRLETGVIRIQPVGTNLRDTIGRAVAAVVPKAEQKNIAISAECPDTLMLYHDGRWTEEALFNILDNAVKYTKDGGSIRIAATVQEIFTKVSIKDSGKGIAEERQAEIFTRFYREPEVHDEEGIGVGLYLARRIIELQNGYITVVSQVGCGADFQVYLPNG